MLETLHIRNFALIEDLAIPWRPGLNVLTGETGAGKSIIVGAMNLLLGDRATVDSIRRGEERADIQAVFDLSSCEPVREFLESMELDASSDQLLIRRVILKNGRGKCFINGAIVTRSLLSKVGEQLVDLHGQHEHQSLIKPDRQLALLDSFAGLGAEVALIQQGYQDLKQSVVTLERLKEREATRNRRIAELEEELDLLDKAELREGEDEEIISRRNVIANSEKVHRLAAEAYDMLFAGETFQPPIVNSWDNVASLIKEIGSIDRSVEKSFNEYDDIQIKFNELADSLQSYIAGLEYDPAELESLEKRLETISKLRRRNDCASLEELIELRESMRAEYDQITGSSEERRKLELEVAQLRDKTGNLAFTVSQKRSEAVSRLEKQIEIHLRELGMQKARFVVSIKQEADPDGLVEYKEKRWKLWTTGVDRVEFLFSANVGEPPKPLRSIASGGEISRIMLAIRAILAQADRTPLIIFDEIDAGVGGRMGLPIAEKLMKVSGMQQVICVTHLPQIAAVADNHILVKKQTKSDRTHTDVDFPRGNDRVREIAKMLGNASSHASRKHAKELLALSRKNR